MQKTDKKENYMYLIIGIGACIMFFAFYGFKVINPTYIEPWNVMSDKSQHYYGWHAFRDAKWSFPLGIMDRITYPDNVSIIFTDSIPLLEIVFKVFSFLLPEYFQYFGLWSLACCILQALVAAHILKYFIDDKVYITIASWLFLVVPIMIHRIFLHEALTAQWLILLAIDTLLLVRNKQSKRIWLRVALIAFLSANIHIYFIMICGIILVGICLCDILEFGRIKNTLVYLGTYLLIAVCVVWILGGFSTSLETGNTEGFGYFCANLNALFNPLHHSAIWNWDSDRTYYWGEGDAYAYLGMGVYVLLLISFVLVLVKKKRLTRVKENKSLVISIIFIVIVSTLVAIGNQVTLNERLLFTIPYPDWIIKIWSSFRCSGRALWIIVYLLMIWGLVVVGTNIKRQWAIAFIILALAIQIYDCHDVLAGKWSDNELAQEWTFPADNNDVVYDKISDDRIQTVVVTPRLYHDERWDDMMSCYMWAGVHHKRCNYFSLARSDKDAFYKRTNDMLCNLSEDCIYVFTIEDIDFVENNNMTYEQVDNYIIAWCE